MIKNNKKPKQIKAYLMMAWYSFLAQTRNKSTFFFGFLFPVVFISIFGLIGNGQSHLTVGMPSSVQDSNPVVSAIRRQSFVSIEKKERSVLNKELSAGKLSGIVDIESKDNTSARFTVHVYISTANIQEGETLGSFVSGVVDKVNLQLVGVNNPAIVFKQDEISGRKFRYIDFALPGQIGFSLLSTALFGTVFGFIFLKKSLVLKRMFSTPMRPLTILLAQGTSRWIMAMLQTTLILFIGVVFFQFYMPHGLVTFLELLVLSSFGLVAFLGFGYFVAGLANDENSAGPLVNLISLPQFLLSGTFFPTDNFPTWLQPIANNLPLTYFNLAVRKLTSEGGNLVDTVPYLLGLAAWGLVMYLLAAKTFKWE